MGFSKLKSRLIFNVFFGFWMFVNKLFINLTCAYLKKYKRCFNVKSSTYCFHMKTKIFSEFQIYIGVPLNHEIIGDLVVVDISVIKTTTDNAGKKIHVESKNKQSERQTGKST